MKLEKGQIFRSVESFPVTCIWERDVVAILDDYSESCDSTFPKGEELTVFSLLESCPDTVHCLVPNHRALLKQMIPADRQNRFLRFGLPTPFNVVVQKSDLLSKCEIIDDATDVPPPGNPAATHHGKLHGMPLAWRGLRVLGAAIGIAFVWFIGAWIRHGRIPLGLFQPRITWKSIGNPPEPIFPPVWLLVVLGVLVIISLAMMALGTQDASPRLKFKKGE